jgi:hypothetical protein
LEAPLIKGVREGTLTANPMAFLYSAAEPSDHLINARRVAVRYNLHVSKAED